MNILQSLADQAKKKKDQLVHDIAAAPQAVGNAVAHIGAAPHPVNTAPAPVINAIQNAKYGVLAHNPAAQQNVIHQLHTPVAPRPSISTGLANLGEAQNQAVMKTIVQPFIARPAMEVAQTARQAITKRPSTYTPGSPMQRELFGNTPVASIQKKVGDQYQRQSTSSNPLLRLASRPLAAGEAAVSVANDIPVVGGLTKGLVKGTAKVAPELAKVAENVAPKAAPALRQIGQGAQKTAQTLDKGTIATAKAVNKQVQDAHAKQANVANYDATINNLQNRKAELQQRIQKTTNFRGVETTQKHIDQIDGQIAQTKAAKPKLSVKDRLLSPNIGLSTQGVRPVDVPAHPTYGTLEDFKNKYSVGLGEVNKLKRDANGTEFWGKDQQLSRQIKGKGIYSTEGLYNHLTAPKATPKAVLPDAAAPPQLPAGRGTGEVSLPNTNTAESRFPLRMMEDERTDPIRPTLDSNAYHDVKHNKDVLAGTGAKIAENEDQALSLAKRGNSTEANATAMQLMHKYLQEGSYDKARDLVQTVGPRFTRQGQETQILSAYSKMTPAGALRYANSELAHAVKDTPKGRALEDATVTAHQNLKGHAKEIAAQLSTEVAQGKISKAANAAKTPEQMLANRIKATTDATKKQAPDPIKDMVNTLHSVAKEVLPAKGKAMPRNPMELIGAAIKDKAGYSDVYEKAQKIVAEKYKDNPEALAELDKYFNSQTTRPFSKSQLNKGVQNGLKGTDLSKIVKSHFSTVDATGKELSDKLIEQAGLSKAEATQLAGAIQGRYNELVQGRKDSIIRQMFGDKPKPEQVTAADRILTMHNLGALSRDELRPLVAKKLGIPSLSEEATKNISDMANKVQTLKDGSPERARATVEMMRYIAQQVPQSATGKTVSVWKAGLLSGVKTQQGNAISNATFAGLKKLSDVPASAVDKGIGMFTGKRTIGLTGKGGISGGRQGIGTGWDTMKTGIDMRQPLSDGKYEQHAELSFKNGIANKLIARPVNTIFRGMSAADQPFYYGAKQNSLYDQAKAAGLTQGLHGQELNRFVADTAKNPTESMVGRANQEAEKSVLGNDTVASRAVTAVKRSIDNSDMSPAGKAAAHTTIDVLAPFTKVPSAFIGRTVDFTPLGIPKTVISQISHGQFDQRALSQAIGEATAGSGVIALGVALSQKNLISGDFPKNDQKEQERWKAEGITPNSVKIGGKWVSMNYIGPAGLLFNAGKQIADAASKGEGAMTRAFSAVGGLGQGLLGQSFLQGFSGFTNAVTDPQRSLSSYVKSQASSVIPSISNDIANLTDPMQRQANGVGQAIEGRIPILRNNALQPKQDVYGNLLKQAGGQVNTLSGLKPSNSLTGNSPAITEANRLHTVNPNDSSLQVTPTPVTSLTIPAATKGDKSTTIKLNPQQKYDLQKQVGQTTQANWNKLIKTPEYKALDDAGKAKALNNLRTDSVTLATRKYVTDNSLGTYAKGVSSKQANLASNGDVAGYTQASSGNATVINKKIDVHSQKVLNEYNTLDAATRKSKAYKENDYDYKVAQAKYDNDRANGRLSKAQKANKETELRKAKVGSSYSKDVRELYGLSKSEVYDLLTTDENGKTYADQLKAYDQKLKDAGLISSLKYKNGFAPSTGGANGSSKSLSTLLAEFKLPGTEDVKSRSKAASLARHAGLAKRRA